MDLKDLLPLFVNGKNTDLGNILAMANGKTTNAAVSELLKKADPKLATMISLSQNSARKAHGLTPILDLADDEIAGKLAKYFATSV